MQTLPPSRKSDQSLQLWAALVNDIGHHVARCDSLPVPKAEALIKIRYIRL